ncbi:hypothetical protein BT10792_17295 [Bacillus thuringiensis]|nr:hypothetical protein BT10792_17295 [Bacillus thuringiensis]
MIKLLNHEIRILRMPYAIPTPALSKLEAIPIKKIENKPTVFINSHPFFSLFNAYYENVEQLCLSVSYTCNKCSTFFQH